MRVDCHYARAAVDLDAFNAFTTSILILCQMNDKDRMMITSA